MESSEGQLALLRVWANGTEFEVDTARTPKANFAGLAKTQGWVGGDANWQLHWEACFKEDYPFGRRDDSTPPVANMDLVDRSRRRLSSSSEKSVASTSSAFSLISAAPSIQSLDTNGSVIGGIVLGLESVKLEISGNAGLSTSNTDSLHSKAPPTLDLSAADTAPAVQPDAPRDLQSVAEASPFWYQYPGFEPNPHAPFKHELGRLCKHVNAQTKKEKKKIQTQALTAEIRFHYGAHVSRLDRWQELCAEVGIEEIPTSITQCQKVLKPVFVNLFNLVDHRRDPELKIQRFQTYGEFNKYTRNGREFPRDCAKQEGFIKVLLKKM